MRIKLFAVLVMSLVGHMTVGLASGVLDAFRDGYLIDQRVLLKHIAEAEGVFYIRIENLRNGKLEKKLLQTEKEILISMILEGLNEWAQENIKETTSGEITITSTTYSGGMGGVPKLKIILEGCPKYFADGLSIGVEIYYNKVRIYGKGERVSKIHGNRGKLKIKRSFIQINTEQQCARRSIPQATFDDIIQQVAGGDAVR